MPVDCKLSKGCFRLAEAGVGTIFCLQEDSDMAYFSLDINLILKRCQERGDIKHVRFPIRDFDPFSLRQRLPEAVAVLVKEAASGRGKLYIHCTAGLVTRFCRFRLFSLSTRYLTVLLHAVALHELPLQCLTTCGACAVYGYSVRLFKCVNLLIQRIDLVHRLLLKSQRS